MKRHPHLHPLSDDHHNALVLARRCRKAGAGDPEACEAAWAPARRRFRLELEPHFRVEEELLLPALLAAGEVDLVERTRREHAELRALVEGPADPQRIAHFGELLHRHVRFEERELFVRAETLLPEETLEAVGRAALAARPG